MHCVLIDAQGQMIFEFAGPFAPDQWDVVTLPDQTQWIVKGRELKMLEVTPPLGMVRDLKAPKTLEMHLFCTVERYTPGSKIVTAS